MQIRSAAFVVSAVNPQQYPQTEQPEIALVGRSNVGKSSFEQVFEPPEPGENQQYPGKTQTINFYHVNGAWYFVDLPGYGFARVARATQARWPALSTGISTSGSPWWGLSNWWISGMRRPRMM